MFGFGKKKKEDIQEIKEAVSPRPEIPVSIPRNLPKDLEYEDLSLGLPQEQKAAPLFVKVDRYREILERLEALKQLLRDMQSIVSIRREIDNLKLTADELMDKHVETFNSLISQLDKEFVRPQIGEQAIRPRKENIDNYIADLQGELSRLQSQVRKLE